MEFSPSRKRLLWRLLIAGIVVNALIFVWVGFGRGHGPSTGTSERQVPPTYSPSPWLKYSRPPQRVRVRPVSPGAPTMTAWVIDNRAALWQGLFASGIHPGQPVMGFAWRRARSDPPTAASGQPLTNCGRVAAGSPIES